MLNAAVRAAVCVLLGFTSVERAVSIGIQRTN